MKQERKQKGLTSKTQSKTDRGYPGRVRPEKMQKKYHKHIKTINCDARNDNGSEQ